MCFVVLLHSHPRVDATSTLAAVGSCCTQTNTEVLAVAICRSSQVYPTHASHQLTSYDAPLPPVSPPPRVERLAEAYPAAPALLFHAYFALVTSTSIALLAPTLYQRRLIDVKGLSAMQFLTAAPAVMSLIDAAVMGSAATNNPIQIYLGFLH